MPYSPPTALASATETRRRELPAACALTLLVGGLSAAITGEGFAVFWAGVMSLLLIADAEIYRRLDARDSPYGARTISALAAWAFLNAAFYASLPAALWLNGQPAGAAAAMVLWVAAVVRHFGEGAGRMLPVAIAGAAPPALSLLIAPLAIATASARPDWDLAVIAAIGGGALMVYVTHARMSAAAAERALTDRAATEDLQHALTQLLFDSNDVTAVLVDRQGRIVAMSRGAEERLGAKGATGRKFEELILLSPQSWNAALARALDGEIVRHAEDEVLTTGGRRWFEWEARPWRGNDGAVRGALAVARDITSLVEARRAAAANEERFRIAMDAGLHVVWEVDYKTCFISWYGDVEALYGEAFTFEQFDKNTTTIIHADDRDMLAGYFHDVAAGEGGSVEHRIVKPDGAIAWAQLSARRVLGRTGGVRKLIVISKDITERKVQEAAFIAAMQRAEKALRAKRALFADINDGAEQEISIAASDVSVADMYEHLAGLMEEMDARDATLADALASLRAARELAENASVSKSQFLASMSHELRTPLNAIIGYSEILQEEAEADGRETDLKDLDRILSAARQLLHLINDILDLSKIEAGRMDVSASDFDVRSLIEEAAHTLRPAIEKNGNVLDLDLAADLGDSRSDPFKLNQCLLNLLSNAAKFTEQGKITVRARRTIASDGDWIEIGVRDSGIGMSAEQVARLFNPFTQAEATTSSKYGGTGLGLAITRRMMQLLGGDVSVTSVEGEGSTFTLRMPARWTEALDSAEDAGTGRVALVIDDEESARDLVQRSLSRLGFDVRGASRGQDGINLAQAISPDVIVLDINLPDMSGWDVLVGLHDAPESAGIPVIVLSIDDDRQRALSLGACEHLIKPVDRDVLAAVAARVARAPTPSASASAGSPTPPIAKSA
ncbi:histidine kinase [alpha proteobacterium U9-1i]|nr:histidine kinase [alpha proteobacterium U9-1i]